MTTTAEPQEVSTNSTSTEIPTWRKVRFPVNLDTISRDRVRELLTDVPEMRGRGTRTITEATDTVVGGRFWIDRDQFDKIQKILFDSEGPVWRRVTFPPELPVSMNCGRARDLLVDAFDDPVDVANTISATIGQRDYVTREDFDKIQWILSGKPEPAPRNGIGANIVREQLLTEGFTQDEVALAMETTIRTNGLGGSPNPILTADMEAGLRRDLRRLAEIPEDPDRRIFRLLEQRKALAEQQEQTRKAQAKLAEFQVQVAEVASRYGEEHDMCSVLDDALGELGLERIRPDYECEMTITVRFTATARTGGDSVTTDFMRRSVDTDITGMVEESLELDNDFDKVTVSNVDWVIDHVERAS